MKTTQLLSFTIYNITNVVSFNSTHIFILVNNRGITMREFNAKVNKERGLRLAECRKEAKLTQEKLAELSHISRQQVWNIENGKRSLTLDNAIIFGNILDVSEKYLMCESKYNSKSDYLEKEMEKIQNIGAYDSGMGNVLSYLPIETKVLISMLESADYISYSNIALTTGKEESNWGYHIQAATIDGREFDIDYQTQSAIFEELLKLLSFQLWKLQPCDLNEINDSIPFI